MERRIPLAIMILAAAALCGCQTEPSEVAAAGASPAVEVPVGPIPGPATQGPGRTNPYGQNPVALREGRQLFVQYNCSGCHGGHAGGGMGPSLRDPVWIYGSSDAHIFDSIAEGRAHGMPAWGTQIPQEEIWQLVAYIKSMRTPNEPEAPE
ncbi:MAG TPA: c-type cytochrome [Bryobacteraceae bacterium]|nr:c-type cytochrome [Bryobacteraceae bacterium]